MRLPALLMLVLVALPTAADETPADFSGLLATHNAARSAVGVGPLAWSNALATEATAWATQLAGEDCQLRYDPDPKRRENTGQNLFRAYGNTPYEGSKRTPEEVAARWVSEGQSYDHARHTCKSGLGSRCGAYLQVIWETTTAVGCGMARCPAAEVWACHYAPRGGQEGLRPYGNAAPSSPRPEGPKVQQCDALPSPAQQLGDALRQQLDPPP